MFNSVGASGRALRKFHCPPRQWIFFFEAYLAKNLNFCYYCFTYEKDFGSTTY
jgi:hypothetical protein